MRLLIPAVGLLALLVLACAEPKPAQHDDAPPQTSAPPPAPGQTPDAPEASPVEASPADDALHVEEVPREEQGAWGPLPGGGKGWQYREGISCEGLAWDRYGPNPPEYVPESERGPWALLVKGPVWHVRDAAGEYFLYRCATGDGDDCNGATAEAVVLTERTASGWARAWATGVHEATYSTCQRGCLDGEAIRHVEATDADGDARMEVLITETNDKPSTFTASLIAPDGTRVVARVDAPLTHPDDSDECVTGEAITETCPTSPREMRFARVDAAGQEVVRGPASAEAVRSQVSPAVLAFLTDQVDGPDRCE